MISPSNLQIIGGFFVFLDVYGEYITIYFTLVCLKIY